MRVSLTFCVEVGLYVFSSVRTIVQDMLLPFFRTPPPMRLHVWMIRVAAVAVALVHWTVSVTMAQLDFVELFIVLLDTHRRPDRYSFVRGRYRTLLVPASLLRSIMAKGIPLLANELLWAGSMAMLSQCYSLRGLSVVAAMNITTTVTNLFSVVLMAMGNSVAIIVGQQLGSGDLDRARDTDRKLIAFAVALSILVGGILALVSPYIPLIYKTESMVRKLASTLLLIGALEMPIDALAVTGYFTIRSGGKTFLTFLFDSAYSWILTIPLAWCLVHFTALPIVPLFFIVRFSNIVKGAIGLILVHSGFWCQNIVLENQ